MGLLPSYSVDPASARLKGGDAAARLSAEGRFYLRSEAE
jgi:hypothetical protein